MERDDYLAGGGDPFFEEHPDDAPSGGRPVRQRVRLRDVLLPRRRRALERTLQAEHNMRVYAERLAARRLRETHQWRGELWQAQRQIRGMTRDLDDAQEAEERLTEELFDTCDELAALRERLRSKGKANAELSQRLREVLHERDQLRRERSERRLAHRPESRSDIGVEESLERWVARL